MMDGGGHATARSEKAAADYFREVGELGAKVESHHERLERVEKRQQTYEARQNQIQVDIASIARLAGSNAEAISKLERLQENAMLRALEPRTNWAGWALGAVLVVLLVLAMSGHFQ